MLFYVYYLIGLFDKRHDLLVKQGHPGSSVSDLKPGLYIFLFQAIIFMNKIKLSQPKAHIFLFPGLGNTSNTALGIRVGTAWNLHG